MQFPIHPAPFRVSGLTAGPSGLKRAAATLLGFVLLAAGAVDGMAAPGDPTPELGPEALRIITSPSTDQELSVIAGQVVVREVYARCGLQVEYLNAPAARAMRIAENGQSDGELARIPLAVNPGAPLIPVDPPLDELHLVPVYLDPELPRGTKILAGNRIGYINGYRMVDSLLPPDTTRVPTSSTAKLIQLLELNRIDVALTLGWDARVAANHNPDLIVGQPLITSPLYHYVHLSREDDLPCLSAKLGEMKASGKLGSLIEDALSTPFPETTMTPGGTPARTPPGNQPGGSPSGSLPATVPPGH